MKQSIFSKSSKNYFFFKKKFKLHLFKTSCENKKIVV